MLRKEIEGCPKYYIYKDGRIWSGKRNIFLATTLDHMGYPVVQLSIESKKKIIKIHRLIATAFISNPLNREEVNHKNGIKTDFTTENLEWCTRGENMKHAYDNGLRDKKAEAIFRGKLGEIDVKEIKYILESSLRITQKEIGRIYGVYVSTIEKIKARETWKFVT